MTVLANPTLPSRSPAAASGAAKLAAAAALCLVMTNAASADSFSNSGSCLRGQVAAYDDATLDQDFVSGGWNKQSGVQVVADAQQVTLQVTDSSGNSICQKLANMSTQCRFVAGFYSTFSIRVDNTQNGSGTGYTLCAF